MLLAIDLNAARGVAYLSLPPPAIADSRTSLSRKPRSKGDKSPSASRNFAWTISSFIEPVTARPDALANRTVPLAGAMRRW